MTDVVTVQKAPIVVLRERLEARRDELKAALGPDIPVDTFVRALMTSVQIDPNLLACTWQSIWTACMRACRDGILPDGQDGAIVAFKSTAQYIIMYPGMLRRFRRSGQFLSISTNIVREGEQFSYYVDEDGEHLHHVPGDGTGSIVKVYARAKTRDGGIFVQVMTKAEIDKRRNMSRTTRDDSPWNRWFEEMARKTVLLRLLKLLPQARDLMQDEYEDDEPGEMPAPAPAQLPPRAPGAAAALDQFAHAPEIEPTQDETMKEKNDGNNDQDTSGDRRRSKKGGHQSDAKG